MMLSTKIFIAFLFAPVFGEQACSPKDVAADDITSLLQTHVEKKAGSAKPSKLAAQGSHSVVEEPARLHKTSMLEKGVAEFIGMSLFVFIGCGAAMSLPDSGGKVFHVSLAFGFAITSLAYAIGHYSGGQLNFAVTFGLMCIQNISVYQGLVNFVFQLLGAIFGSMLTLAVFSADADNTRVKDTGAGGLGVNAVSAGFTQGQALVGEIMGTFFLVYVVMETAVNPATVANRSLACVAIGISVFLAHSLLIPVDGCSINPTRSFGPMVVKWMCRHDRGVMTPEGKHDTYLSDHWIFWVGPLLGALFAALIYQFMHNGDESEFVNGYHA